VQQGALHLDLPITVGEAYRGAKVSLPTPRGTVTLTVPAGTQSGQTVRLRGEGLPNARGPAGDLYVQFQIRIPTTDAQDVREAIDKLEALAEGDIRGDLRF
jgi:curved DNA-binding protein